MKSEISNPNRAKIFLASGALAVSALLSLGVTSQKAQTSNQNSATSKQAAPAKTKVVPRGTGFLTPQNAVDALVDAAEKYDTAALTRILGPGSKEIVDTGEPAADKQRAADFVSQARAKQSIVKDPKNPTRRILNVGNDDWPFPVPLVKQGTKWYFDAATGRREILLRRVGQNELDAIQICRGYVEAQNDYALLKRGNEGSGVNQYAQQIISTEGQQDGLAWKNADGTWGGPIGEKVAGAITRGYSKRDEPYHGYFFKVLKGQGPDAPLGQLDYVVKGMMIGGFALIASPAQYRITGVKTFIVSQDGVVWEKDMGPKTLELFQAIDRFNPDRTWTPVKDTD